MTDAPKKRPWFQFHLSTAVILMFVAGGLMWANATPRTLALFPPTAPGKVVHGFPCQLGDGGVVLNLLSALAMIVAIGVACERFTRGTWRLWRCALLIGGVAWLPLGLFLTGYAMRHVTFQREELIGQGWPLPVVIWQWDALRQHWVDFPSPIGGLADMGAVLTAEAACLAACVGLLYLIERLMRRRERRQ